MVPVVSAISMEDQRTETSLIVIFEMMIRSIQPNKSLPYQISGVEKLHVDIDALVTQYALLFYTFVKQRVGVCRFFF